jgi:hypothetical protein
MIKVAISNASLNFCFFFRIKVYMVTNMMQYDCNDEFYDFVEQYVI